MQFSRPPLSSSPRKQPRWLWLAVVLLAGAGGAYFLLRHHAPVPTPAEEASAPPGTFRATEAEWASFKFDVVEEKTFHRSVQAEGKIVTNDDTTTPVFSPYSGRVLKIFAEEGEHVKRGAPLMSIAASEFAQGQSDLVAAKQALDNAASLLKLATTNEKRQHALYDAKAGALKDWQQAQADLETAKVNFHTAEGTYNAVRNRLSILGVSSKDIAAIAKGQKKATAQAEALVTAPISGTLTQRQVGIGEYINSAANGATTPAFSIADLSSVWGVANVREDDVQIMHGGQNVEVHVLAYPDHVFKAKLIYVAPTVDPTSHRLFARVEIKNKNGALKPEMFANFTIIVGNDTQAIAVPEEAVIFEGDTARVWVAGSNKQIALRPIEAGPVHDGMVEVLGGLKQGEMVVTSGSLFIDRAAKVQTP